MSTIIFMTLLLSILNTLDISGGVEKCHGLVLAMHLMKLLKSSRKFIDLMSKNFQHMSNIDCLQQIHTELKV